MLQCIPETMTNQLNAIEHLVVLALENRSFDQMLGFLYEDRGNKSPTGQQFEGLTGEESNPDASGKPVRVFKITADMKNAYFMPGCDPGEDYTAVNQQLFGTVAPPSPPVATNQGFLANFAKNLPARSKNPHFGALPGTVPNNIMGMFTPQMLPILSGLARGFAVCDHWFASVPTETFPNRAFMCAATSQGKMGDVPAKPYVNAPSIFGRLTDAGIPWAIYGYTEKALASTDYPDTLNAPADSFPKFADFKAAAAAGTLPAYSFLEPEWGPKGNSQHPNYDVSLGEQLIHDVYYALQNGKNWNQTLLIITYDEHGGNYDHVPPPQGAIPPDNSVGEQGFDFKRFGVRVPAVLVSPLIEAGTVFRVPDGAVPLDHTSILKTVERRWNLLPLTARDAAAPDIGDALTLTVPRTDDPLAGVVVPTSSGKVTSTNRPSHIQRIQAEGLAFLPVVDSQGRTDHEMPRLTSASDYTDYIKRRTAAWQKSADELRSPKPRQRSRSASAIKSARNGTGPKQVVILRHGEKPSDPRNPDLSPIGVQRADMLARAISALFPKPDFLFAAAPSRNSNRPVETLTPLAMALTLPLHADIADSDFEVLVDDLLHDPIYSNKVAIVCWHHGNIPDLALALRVPESEIENGRGMDGMRWNPAIFDLFWSIVFSRGAATLSITKQPAL